MSNRSVYGESYEIAIPNKDTVYNVYDAFNHQDYKQNAGVEVIINGKIIADIKCSNNITDNILDLSNGMM